MLLYVRESTDRYSIDVSSFQKIVIWLQIETFLCKIVIHVKHRNRSSQYLIRKKITHKKDLKHTQGKP